jgi:predicted acylesterase/phospholipase RssA
MATRPARTANPRSATIAPVQETTAPVKTDPPKVKRAITLGGGGPAAGLHIGVLDALQSSEIKFDVWALSCIGAWVGIVYNQWDDAEVKNKAERTYQFFRDGVFRDDEGYERFPINTVFGTDWRSNIKALNEFVTDADNYRDFAWDPYKMMDSFQDSLSFLFDRMPGPNKKFRKLDEGDINGWILNHAMATNPFVRYFTSMMYLSDVTGLSRINYPNSDFMKGINFENLFEKKGDEKKPFIFHNAWNLDAQELAFFSNKEMKGCASYRGAIDASTLCACSALPFVEQTVKINNVTYCEGALVDTVSFETLLEQHPDLDEIWVSRIVDSKQIRKPENLHDALANLCQLFAATVGEDDVKLFKYHVQCDPPKAGMDPWTGTVVEIHVPGHINFKWNHSNLDNGRELGRAAAQQAIDEYDLAGTKTAAQNKLEIGKARFVNEDPAQSTEWKKVQKKYNDMKRIAG